jgi:hypothetical protein
MRYYLPRPIMLILGKFCCTSLLTLTITLCRDAWLTDAKNSDTTTFLRSEFFLLCRHNVIDFSNFQLCTSIFLQCFSDTVAAIQFCICPYIFFALFFFPYHRRRYSVPRLTIDLVARGSKFGTKHQPALQDVSSLSTQSSNGPK